MNRTWMTADRRSVTMYVYPHCGLWMILTLLTPAFLCTLALLPVMPVGLRFVSVVLCLLFVRYTLRGLRRWLELVLSLKLTEQ